MIDFHTHILSGIDDGSKSVEESLQLLQMEAAQGITEVVLTPHFYADQNSISRFLQRRQRACDRLAPALTEELPKLRLGAEVQYFEGLCRTEELEALRIQDSNLLLVEMPFSTWTQRMVEDILELNRHSGLQVVLAHIERYRRCFSRKQLETLLSAGVLCQANLSFFSRWQTRHQAMSMLNGGQIHILGSDCHSCDHRPPNWELLPEKVRERAERVDMLFTARYLTGDVVYIP